MASEVLRNEMEMLSHIEPERFSYVAEDSVQFTVFYKLDQQLKVSCGCVSINIDYLGPIDCVFIIDSDYPDSQPIVELKADWLPESVIEELIEFTKTRLIDGCESLYSAYMVCKNDLLDLILPESDRGRFSVDSLETLDGLNSYNEQQLRLHFLSSTIECSVCFMDDVKGIDAVRLYSCGHTFCTECVREHLKNCVATAQVNTLNCLASDCDKVIDFQQVRNILDTETFNRLDSMLLNRLLDTDDDLIYCPRPTCNYPTQKQPKEVIATCPLCEFTFCIFCLKANHGLNPCSISEEQIGKLLGQYEKAGKAEKQHMHSRYGEKRIKTLIDERASRQFLSVECKQCPKCGAFTQRAQGCNKMQCTLCLTYFCYLCGDRVPAQNPYSHFNSMSRSRCANQLFTNTGIDPLEMVEWDDDDD